VISGWTSRPRPDATFNNANDISPNATHSVMLTASGMMISVRKAAIDSVGSFHSTWRNPPSIKVPTRMRGAAITGYSVVVPCV
jgi:hypothetical protein